MPDQQMRPEPRYPVDRYLGESSKKNEMVINIGDDLWNSDPGLRPEDEYILRKLQEMLQSTAEDLKVLSQEMSKFHEPRVQVKTLPTPLDEEFNEKVHIEELVDAKFYGYKIVDPVKESASKNNILNNVIKTAASALKKNSKTNIKTQKNPITTTTKQPIAKKLGITKTKILNIIDDSKSKENIKSKPIKPKVAEFSYSHIETDKKDFSRKKLQIQHMPGINIRSELKEQRVLQIDILPEKVENTELSYIRKNISVVSASHEVTPSQNRHMEHTSTNTNPSRSQHSLRKVSKMSPYEGSSSNNSVSPQRLSNIEKRRKVYTQTKPIHKTVIPKRKLSPNSKKNQKPQYKDLELWKKKLNVVYNPSYTAKNKEKRVSTQTEKITGTPPKPFASTSAPSKPLKKPLNNAQYIPYSFFTVGGARASDIEKEINEISDRGELPLSPILDKILSSRENSYSEQTKHKQNLKILTESDEDLLKEVIDIEEKVCKTLRKTKIKNQKDSFTECGKVIKDDQPSLEHNVSYDDDFEDEKSDDNISEEENSAATLILHRAIGSETDSDKSKNLDLGRAAASNATCIKRSNLSFKESVDVFEFVHAVETQESSTQSHTLHKISLKETQTSPPNETSTLQSIHNDLWSEMDPKGKVEKLFKSEKEFIKQLILEEYGDLVEKTIAKPSTSRENTETKLSEKNVSAAQKLTQTSPARVQSSMTSPQVTKTRTTSPLPLSVKVDRHTSPFDFLTSVPDLNLESDHASADLGISINLSSPRFSLRFPQNSRELLTNLEVCDKKMGPKVSKHLDLSFRNYRESTLSSSSSAEMASTSEMSSLGEIYKPKRKASKSRVAKISESSSSSSQYYDSSDMHSNEIPHLKSDGEWSFKQISRVLRAQSAGEMDLGRRRRKK